MISCDPMPQLSDLGGGGGAIALSTPTNLTAGAPVVELVGVKRQDGERILGMREQIRIFPRLRGASVRVTNNTLWSSRCPLSFHLPQSGLSEPFARRVTVFRFVQAECGRPCLTLG